MAPLTKSPPPHEERDAFLAVCRGPWVPHLWRPNLSDEEEDHTSLAPLLEHIAEWGEKHLARGTG